MNRPRRTANNNRKRVLTEAEIDEMMESDGDLSDALDDFSASESEYQNSSDNERMSSEEECESDTNNAPSTSRCSQPQIHLRRVDSAQFQSVRNQKPTARSRSSSSSDSDSSVDMNYLDSLISGARTSRTTKKAPGKAVTGSKMVPKKTKTAAKKTNTVATKTNTAAIKTNTAAIKTNTAANKTKTTAKKTKTAANKTTNAANTTKTPANVTGSPMVIWNSVPKDLIPRKPLSFDVIWPSIISPKLNRTSTPCDVFEEFFPKSLINWIAQCTNRRLEILRKEVLKNPKKKYISRSLYDTDPGEIRVVLGIFLVMSYNKVPKISDYWSQDMSFGNAVVREAISRTRFQLLTSKFYYAEPEKPADASKTHYIDDVVAWLKSRFPQVRSDSKFHSIDETMTKFKGRSSLKQYMPLKPTKRGIKLWTRSDSYTGYVYDFNVYRGKEEQSDDTPNKLTLGERVVLSLTKTIRLPEAALAFDRFFTSVDLIDTIPFSAVGTVISSRRNVPKFSSKLDKSESEFRCNSNGTVVARWMDSKEVVVISNCHANSVSTVTRKQKDGQKKLVPCPAAIEFYNAIMGGVDLTDQIVGQYDADRKSEKWWRKVFYRLFMTAVSNSSIVYQELTDEKIPLQFSGSIGGGAHC